jgi:hypothetical protein
MNHDLAQMVPPVFPRPLMFVYATGALELAVQQDYCCRNSRGWRQSANRASGRALSCERARSSQGHHAGWPSGNTVVAAIADAAAVRWPSLVVYPAVARSALWRDCIVYRAGLDT